MSIPLCLCVACITSFHVIDDVIIAKAHYSHQARSRIEISLLRAMMIASFAAPSFDAMTDAASFITISPHHHADVPITGCLYSTFCHSLYLCTGEAFYKKGTSHAYQTPVIIPLTFVI
jgi:hypothetical protein